jgi:quinol monooxygenase YgiN
MSESTTGQGGPSAPPAPDQFTVLTQLVAKPGHESDVCDSLLHLVRGARTEPGNLSYDLHRLKNNPAAFYVLANWADRSAFDRHGTSPHVRAFLDREAGSDLVAAPMFTSARPLSRPDTRPNRPRARADSPTQMTLLPFFTVKAGEVDTVRQAHQEMVEPTRAEPGCLDYDLYQSREDPAVMFFYENWSDQQALATHMNTPNFHWYIRGQVDPRLVVPWTAHVMEMVSQPSG